MGCDAHFILQRKDFEGQWSTIANDLFSGRDYRFFSICSGVRGDTLPGGPIFTEGLPRDVKLDLEDRFEGYYMGEHSYGHLYIADAISAIRNKEVNDMMESLDEYSQEAWYDFKCKIKALITVFDNYGELRLVVGYDS